MKQVVSGSTPELVFRQLVRFSQTARMAWAASATSAFPNVIDPYSDRLRLRLNRSSRVRACSPVCEARDSAYSARALWAPGRLRVLCPSIKSAAATDFRAA